MNRHDPDTEPLDLLVGRAAAGDANAFRRLVRREYGRIHRWALGRTGEPDDADDVVQAVLLKLHRGLGSYHGRAPFTTWLYRVTVNAAEELERKRRRRSHLLETKLDPSPASHEPATDRSLDAAALTRLVLDRFRGLPDRQREVFDLVDLQGCSPAEVAEMLDLAPVTVRTNLLRARRSIRGAILRSHPELVEEYRP